MKLKTGVKYTNIVDTLRDININNTIYLVRVKDDVVYIGDLLEVIESLPFWFGADNEETDFTRYGIILS